MFVYQPPQTRGCARPVWGRFGLQYVGHRDMEQHLVGTVAVRNRLQVIFVILDRGFIIAQGEGEFGLFEQASPRRNRQRSGNVQGNGNRGSNRNDNMNNLSRRQRQRLRHSDRSLSTFMATGEQYTEGEGDNR